MSVLTRGGFSVHLAFLLWLESKEAQDSVLININLRLFSNKGAFIKSVVGGVEDI